MNTKEVASTTTVTAAEVTTTSADSAEQSAAYDALLARRVEAALASELDLSATTANVGVDVTEGIVTLGGAVDELSDKPALEAVVSKVPGVAEILDKVEVSPSRADDPAEIDDRIAFSIQRAFITDPSVSNDAERVTIDVSNAAVVLRGSTPDDAARQAVQRVVFETPGVSNIKNLLAVDER